MSSPSIHKSRVFTSEEVDDKNLFPAAMYAHLCHSDVEPQDGDRNSSKRILQYFPQPHQFHTIDSRAPSPSPLIGPATIFPHQQLYNGHQMGNLHEGMLCPYIELSRLFHWNWKSRHLLFRVFKQWISIESGRVASRINRHWRFVTGWVQSPFTFFGLHLFSTHNCKRLWNWKWTWW